MTAAAAGFYAGLHSTLSLSPTRLSYTHTQVVDYSLYHGLGAAAAALQMPDAHRLLTISRPAYQRQPANFYFIFFSAQSSCLRDFVSAFIAQQEII